MRYGILSDIHGNLSALQRVLAVLADEDIDKYLCLGDIVGYGASPNECCQTVQDIEAVCVRGNHEEAVINPAKEAWFNLEARACIVWTRQQLTEANRQFLSSLMPVAEVDDIILCHGSIPEPDYYITTPADARASFETLSTSVGFFGHTHYAEWFAYKGDDELPEEHPCPTGGICDLATTGQYLINPGAVGQPRDGNPQASFAIYDQDNRQVHIRRLDYDIGAAQQKILATGLPAIMAQRLVMGM